MDCPKVLKDLVAFLDGALDQESSAQIKQHLEFCPACNKEAQLLTRTWNLLDKYPELELKPQVVSQTQERLREIAQPKLVLFPQRWTWQKIAGLATAALLLIVFGLYGIIHTFKPTVGPGIKIAETKEVKKLKDLLNYYTEFLEDLEEINKGYYDILEENGSEELPSFSIPEEPFNSSVFPEDKNINI